MNPPPATRHPSQSRRKRGFTLLELLVVIGLIAAMSFLFLGGLGGGGKSAALLAGQSTVANLLAAARTRAMASGNPVRVLVQDDRQSPLAAERYLHVLALEEQRAGAGWETIQTVSLPAGIYIVPYQGRTPPNIFGAAAAWTKLDGTKLQSSLLSKQPDPRPIDGALSESWAYVEFTPAGTAGSNGLLVVAAGRPLPPGGYATGDAPFVLENQETVRGVQLSAYGLAILINDRTGF